jgi:hypothetical protein
MSGIPISRLSRNAIHQLAIYGAETLSVESSLRILEKADDRLALLRLQLVPNMHNNHVLSRVRRRIDALESAADELHRIGLRRPGTRGERSHRNRLDPLPLRRMRRAGRPRRPFLPRRRLLRLLGKSA